jgi:8-oxo-dGTP pyrophosphatase MutT (NUDIX family)
MKTYEYIDTKYTGQNTLKRDIAKVVFHDGEGKVLLQDRKSISKSGEEWGLFGGGMEDGETPYAALLRELTEEIADLPKNLEFKFILKQHVIYFSMKQNSYRELYENVFISELPKSFIPKILEGDGAKWFEFESLKDLKWIPGDYEAIKLLLKKD